MPSSRRRPRKEPLAGPRKLPVRSRESPAAPRKLPAAGGRDERVLERLRALCLALPDTSEVIAWGHPTFRVGGKIFVGFGIEDGVATIGFKADGLEQQELVETEPQRYRVAKYVGKHGWVSMRADGRIDWSRIERHVADSYRRIAGPRQRAKLDRPAGG